MSPCKLQLARRPSNNSKKQRCGKKQSQVERDDVVRRRREGNRRKEKKRKEKKYYEIHNPREQQRRVSFVMSVISETVISETLDDRLQGDRTNELSSNLFISSTRVLLCNCFSSFFPSLLLPLLFQTGHRTVWKGELIVTSQANWKQTETKKKRRVKDAATVISCIMLLCKLV